MPCPVEVSIERWGVETGSTIQGNLPNLLDIFAKLRTLYPEIAKFPPETDLFTLALRALENTEEAIWIVSLNIPDVILPDGWDEADSSKVPAFYEPDLSSRRLWEETGGRDQGWGNLSSGLLNFPGLESQPLEEATSDEDVLGGGGYSDNTLPPLKPLTFGTVPDTGATSKPESSNQTLKSQEQALEPLLQPHTSGAFDETEKPTPKLKLIRHLPELHDPEDQHNDEIGLRRLTSGIKEQYVAGLAFAMPSAIRLPGIASKFQSPNVDHGGGTLSEADSRAKQAHQLETRVESYDIGLLLDFALVRENPQFLTSCQQDITPDMEVNLTQDVIFSILLDLEKTITVSQFQVLIAVSGYAIVPNEYESILAAFLTMGFTQESDDEIHNYRGFDEPVVVFTIRMDEWERYKEGAHHVTEDFRRGKVDKGKGKAKANPFGL